MKLLKEFKVQQPLLKSKKKFTVKNYASLFGLKGLSDALLKNHFKLYEGYVKNCNSLVEELHDLTIQHHTDHAAFSELKRRLGWEYNGMKLHELYFENMTTAPESASRLNKFKKHIDDDFGRWEEWKNEFLGTALSRGIGWVVTYKDTSTNQLTNCWVDEHNNGHLIGCVPILVLDVFEHAYIGDYGLDRKQYVTNFFNQINWAVIENRLDS